MSEAIGEAEPRHADRWEPFLAARARSDETVDGEGIARGPLPRRDIRGGTTAGRGPFTRRKRRVKLHHVGAVAAFSIFLVVLGPYLLRAMQADYMTGTAELRTISLEDDSTVTLAPDSAVSVSFTKDERLVHLLAGEAFFEVNPDSQRPFRVAGDDVRVTAVGTSFSVRQGDDQAGVGVAQGVVRVNGIGAWQGTETLTIGETMLVVDGGGIVRAKVPVSQIAAWRHHQLIAEDQPLEEVVGYLRHYFAGAIIVTSEELVRQPVTGVFTLDDPVRALRGIARSQHARVRQITPWLLVMSAS